MTTGEITGLVLALLVMTVGLAGSFLPGIPSTPLVLLAVIGHKLYFGAHGVGWFVMTLLVGLTLLSWLADYLASLYGAKRFGATWRGMLGAVLGGLVGLFFGFPGLVLGPFVGAFLLEWLGRRKPKEALRAGVGATLGLLAGAVGKFGCCLLMMGLFALNVVYRSLA